MSDAPFRVEFDQSAFVGNYAVRVNGTYYCGFHTLTEADMCRDEANAAWEAAGGPALARQRDEAVELLTAIQWNNREGHQRVIPRCPCCRGIKPGTCDEAELSSLYPGDRVDHAPDCRLAAALRRGEGK